MDQTTTARTRSGRRRGLARTVWLRYARRKLAVVALAFIVLQILMAVFAPLGAPYPPLKSDYDATWSRPTRAHLFGTDDLGRDVLSRIVYGARVSLSVGIVSQLIALAVGVPIGVLAAMAGRWVDYVTMRIIEVLSAVPSLLFYILLMVALGGGFWNIIIAMSITSWIGYARVVRGQVLSLKETDYVRAARSMGARPGTVAAKHLVRNAISPVIVSFTLGIPGAMFAEAGLSFLGIGISPPQPSWGQMIGLYQSYLFSSPYLTLIPAAVLAFSMLCWMIVGDSQRDAMDPMIRL